MHVVRMAAVMALVVGLSVAVHARAADAATAASEDRAAHAPALEVTWAFARRNLWNWEADGEKGIWVQGIGHEWYYGKFMAPCFDLPFRDGVSFKFGPSGELDKFSAIVIRRNPPCNFISFTRSDGPPHAKKGKAPAATAPVPSATPSPEPAGPSS
jgi:hypothetical protein